MPNQEMFRTGSFTATSGPAATYIELGWVPDVVTVINVATVAGQVGQVIWHRGTMGEGVCMTQVVRDCASTGLTMTWAASGGLTSTNTNVKKPTCWVASTVYAVGDIVHPTTLNGYFYKALTAGTSHSAEPTWLIVPAGTTAEGGGAVTWTCYAQADLPVLVAAKKGFTIPAAMQVASVACYWEARRYDAAT
jgi:hypothetical protein